MAERKQRVAVIGAKGIGRHHAKWWHTEGVEVCAFAGTSAASVAAAEEKLKGLFDFQGRGYVNVPDMLTQEVPDIVDICSPDEYHAEHARSALAAGCRVLCEKPLVYSSGSSGDELLNTAENIAELSRKHNLTLALCSQYAAAVDYLLNSQSVAPVETPVTEFHGELASPVHEDESSPLGVWFDLGPHLIAVVQMLRPNGTISKESIQVHPESCAVSAFFTFEEEGIPSLNCTLDVYRTRGEPKNVRRLSLNNVAFDIEGAKDKNGVYSSHVKVDGHEFFADDFLRLLIRRMRDDDPPLSVDAAVSNLRLLLEIKDRIG